MNTVAEPVAWGLKAYHSGAMLRLLDLLQHGDGFQLLVVEYTDNTYRQHVIAQLAGEFPRQTECDAAAYGDFSEFERALCALAADHAPVHVSGMETWLAGSADLAFIHAFNHHREYFARQLAVPVILWLWPSHISRFAHEAADLWAWRSAVLDFCLQAETSNAVQQHYLDLGQASVTEQSERLQEIDAYLQGRDPLYGDAVLYREKAEILQRQGNIAAALAAAEAAADIAKRYDDRRSYAIAKSLEADIMEKLGQFEEALAIRREELLIFDKLGDIRERAITHSRIAGILGARGQFDEALTILRKEILPTFNKLGNLRERAVTLGKIADILQMRGQVDEALSIRQNEELPTFLKLGDMREYAVTLGKIAQILPACGQLDEALAILREELLPTFKLLGDVRSQASTLSTIAGILWTRGQYDEALVTLRNQVLPTFEKTGDIRSSLITKMSMALLLLQRDGAAANSEANTLLCEALAAAQAMRIPEEDTIRAILNEHNLHC